METCSLSDFMASLKPWLSGDYLRRVYRDEKGRLVLLFTDNVTNVYEIDDCTDDQLVSVLQELSEKGVPVET